MTGVKLWPKSLLASWTDSFQNLLVHTNSNRPILMSIGNIYNFLPTSYSFISVSCAIAIYQSNYKHAHWKLNETFYQTPKTSFPGRCISKLTSPQQIQVAMGCWTSGFSSLIGHKNFFIWWTFLQDYMSPKTSKLRIQYLKFEES